jgi:FixJ family two-component response regulator
VTPPFIAVVDDDEALCSSLVDLMRSLGYRAERPREARSVFSESRSK